MRYNSLSIMASLISICCFEHEWKNYVLLWLRRWGRHLWKWASIEINLSVVTKEEAENLVGFTVKGFCYTYCVSWKQRTWLWYACDNEYDLSLSLLGSIQPYSKARPYCIAVTRRCWFWWGIKSNFMYTYYNFDSDHNNDWSFRLTANVALKAFPSNHAHF